MITDNILFNVFQRCDSDTHKIETQLSNLETRYSFNFAQTQPCQHKGLMQSIMQFNTPINPYSKVYLTWNMFVILAHCITAVLWFHGGLMLCLGGIFTRLTASLDCLLHLDCFIRMQTPYAHPNGIYITDFYMMFRRWLRFYALSDFILLFPFDLLFYPLWKYKVMGDYLCRRLICYVRLIRFFRCSLAWRNSFSLGEIYVEKKRRIQIFRMMLGIFGLISVVGTCWVVTNCKPGMCMELSPSRCAILSLSKKVRHGARMELIWVALNLASL